MGTNLALLAIITIVGIAGYYAWLQYVEQRPTIPEPEAQVPFDSFALVRPLQRQVARKVYAVIDSARSGKNISIYASHYPSNCHWGHNAEVPFPLASLNKIPIACKVFEQIDARKLALDSSIVVYYDDLRPFSYLGSIIKPNSPTKLTVRELLEMMLQQSDNCAADKLLQLVGGIKPVEQLIHQHGFTDITLRRTLFQLFSDLYQMKISEDSSQWTFSNWERWTGTSTEAQKDAGRKAIHNDLTDKATARNLTELMAYIGMGKMLSPQSSRNFIAILSDLKRGEKRMPGLLPIGTQVAHKTGTLRGLVHDTGLVIMPNNKGFLLITVLIRHSSRTMEEDEATIAQITKAIYSVF